MLGQEDLVGRLAMGITRDIAWVIGVVSILTESPDPPSIQDLMRIHLLLAAPQHRLAVLKAPTVTEVNVSQSDRH